MRRGNPYHDEKGRFCSANRAKTISQFNEQPTKRRLNSLFAKEEDTAYQSLKKGDRKTYAELIEKEPEITAMMKEQCNLIGLEYRVKSPSSIASKLARIGGKAAGLNDILRYTHISEPKTLSGDCCRILQNLQSEGVEIIQLKNSWLDETNPYNGINVKLKKENVKFELQFHTEESFRVKDGEMHRLYEKARELPENSKEHRELKARMFEIADSMERPDGIEAVRVGEI